MSIIRVANDYYPTPAPLVDGILDILGSRIKHQDILFDCAAGHGAIVDRCKLRYPNSFGNEPYPSLDYQPAFTLDATQSKSWDEFGSIDLTITNTPFDIEIMMPMLTHAIERSRRGVVALVRVTWIEPCENRVQFLAEYADRLRYFVPVNPRPKFRTDTKGSDNATVAWMVWDRCWSWRSMGLESPFKFITDWKNEANYNLSQTKISRLTE